MVSEMLVIRFSPRCPKCGSKATRFWDEILREISNTKEAANERFLLYCQNCGCTQNIISNSLKKEKTIFSLQKQKKKRRKVWLEER